MMRMADSERNETRSARFDTRRITTLAILTCVAAAVSFFESAFPPLIPMAPGAKLGLSNVAPLLALILLGVGDAYIVMSLKCLTGAMFSGGMSLMYSVPSGFAALTVEVLLFLFIFDRVSIAGISLIGAVIFNAVQVGVACAITGVNLITLLPWLMLAGLLAGAFTGLLTYNIVKKLPYSAYGGNRKRICINSATE